MKKSRKAMTSVIAAATSVALVGGPVHAASHREAPLTAADPQIDATDLYAFMSPDASDTVTLISNWVPMQEPAGGPNFYPWATDALYDINIDNDHDAVPDLIYRWQFKQKTRDPNTFLYNTGPVENLNDATLNRYQTYTLTEFNIDSGKSRILVRDRIAAPAYVGDASMPNYDRLREQAIHPVLGDEGKVFVGQADDPFFLDLRVFDLLYGTDLSETGDDTLNGYNVNTLALQLPMSALAAQGNEKKNPIIGVWTTARRQQVRTILPGGKHQSSGVYRQVSRLGMPLVNEVVVPIGSKDLFNSSAPANDAAYLPAVQKPEVPKLLELLYDIPAPKTPRDDLVSVFLTGVEKLNMPADVTPSEQLRLNMSIQPSATEDRMGVLGGDTSGFPNGRRLTDDVIDITLQVAAGELVGAENDLGDGVDQNDVAFDATFPYVALPHSGSETANSASTSATTDGNSTSSGTEVDEDQTVPTAATSDEDSNGMPALVTIAIALLLGTMAFMALRRRNRSTTNSH